MPATARPTPNPPDSWPAWFLLRIQTSRANGRKWHPRLLRLHPAATLWLDADRDRARLETGHATRPEAEQARTEIRRLLQPAGKTSAPAFTTRIVRLPPANWADAWKKYFHARQVSPRLTISPPWEHPSPPPGGSVIAIDPGRSFGTGLHATTRGCLLFLDRLARRPPHRSLLDIGCGSGILAIAGARLGFRPVHGVDNDPIAVREARVNARRNALHRRVRFESGAVKTLSTPHRAEVVVANLIAGLLIREAPAIARCVARRPGAALILSGIRHSQFPAVQARYERLGFTLRAPHTRAGWTTGWFERTRPSSS